MQNNKNDSDLVTNKLKSLQIRDLFDDTVILKFLTFITKNENNLHSVTDQSIDKIENYINSNSSKWIYRTIIQNNPETRYLVLLQHFFDRNPNNKKEILSLLSSETKFFVNEVEKFFGLGC